MNLADEVAVGSFDKDGGGDEKHGTTDGKEDFTVGGKDGRFKRTAGAKEVAGNGAAERFFLSREAEADGER